MAESEPREVSPSRHETVQFLTTTSLALFAAVSLLRANVYYWDDLSRTLIHGGWDSAARPFATILFRLITGSDIFDFAPISQIIGIVVTSLSAHVIAWRLFRIRDPIACTVVSLSVAISPYYFAVYAFRFDSVVYGIGFLFSIIAVYLSVEAPHPLSRVGAFALVLLSYGVNPPMAGAGLVVLAQLWCIRFVERGEYPFEIQLSALWLTAFHLIAMICVKLYAEIAPVWEYTQIHGSITPTLIPTNVLRNTINVDTSIARDWSSSLLGFAFFVVVVGAVASMLIWWALKVSKVRGFADPIFWPLLAFPSVLILTYAIGPIHITALLDNPITSARVRTGFGPLIAASFAFLFQFSQGSRRLRRFARLGLKGLALAVIVWMIVFGAIFGNALSVQTEFNKAIAQQIHSSFVAIQQTNPTINYATIVGDIRQPPRTNLIFRRFNALADMVPQITRPDAPVQRMFFRLFGASLPSDLSCTNRGRSGPPTSTPVRREINFDVYIAADCAIFIMAGSHSLDERQTGPASF
jgi:hypothetical protein